MIYSCDFETSKNEPKEPTKTWVYLWGAMNIDNESFVYGRSIKEFIEDFIFNKTQNKDSIYFHNLKFDGSFILNYILRNKEYMLIIKEGDKYGEKTLKSNNKNKEEVINKILKNSITDCKDWKKNYMDNGLIDKNMMGLKNKVLVKTNINNMGIWYSIELDIIEKDKRFKRIKIYDSLKLLNYKVENIATDFLSIQDYVKLDYDYEVERKVEDELEEHDIEYIKRDCEIVARALKVLKNEFSISKNTAASASLDNFKKSLDEMCGEEKFRELFPVLEYQHLRDKKGNILNKETETEFAYTSYKGGLVYVNPKIKNKCIVHNNSEKEGKEPIGMVLDANSLYPSVMMDENNIYPCGYGVKFEGKYEYNEEYPIFIQRIVCQFKLKKDKLPMVSLKSRDFVGQNCNIEIAYNELLIDSNFQWVELTLNSVDLELFFSNYEIIKDFEGNDMIEYVGGYMYKGIKNIFNEYLEYWAEKKSYAVKTGNKTLKGVTKIFMNGLYGKFGTKSTNVKSKIPYIENGVLKFISGNPEDEEPVYMPMASFIAAYARKELNKMYDLVVKVGKEVYGDDNYNCFCYCDTDSLHVLLTEEDIRGSELEDYIDDGSKFGYWKKEIDFYRAKYIRPKTYLEQCFSDGYIEWYKKLSEEYIKENKVKYYYVCACAGLPNDKRKEIDFSNFNINKVFYNVKLIPKQIDGGVVLVEEDFEIKDNKVKIHKGGEEK